MRILRSDWVTLPEGERANYYRGLLRFQKEYEYPLRVFSLNYDLCVETACATASVQRGFSERTWDWRLFDETSEDPPEVLLYKLHGSTDWCLTDEGRVRHLDSTASIPDEKAALIFGDTFKLQYTDPFLFLAYELRRWTLDVARVIVCVGYGFNDDHINGILQQSLRQDRDRRLVAVVGPSGVVETEERRIEEKLDASPGQVKVEAKGAREFLCQRLSVGRLGDLLPAGEELFPETES